MKKIFTVICSVLLVIPGICIAQQGNQKNNGTEYDFLQRKQVIFDDDFSQDAVGAFPSKWRRLDDVSLASSKPCKVKKHGDSYWLETSDAISDIEPAINDEAYLTDSFTLEYDFMLGKDSTSTVDIDFRAKHAAPAAFDWFTISGNGIASYLNLNTGNKYASAYPGKFTPAAWHHLAVSYEHGIFKLYVDQYLMLTVPSYYGYPMFSFGMHCRPPGKIKDMRLATGPKDIPEKPEPHATVSLAVSPNADQKSFTIKVSSVVKENALITITNLVGDKIKEFMTTTNTDKEVQLDTPPGIYCISAITKEKTLTAKIALQ